MNRIPVIMDVDTGLDDALAILMASCAENIQILGIACVNGNVRVEDTYRNTRFIAKLLELKMPIAKGAAYPMINKVLHAKDAHGSFGLGSLKVEMETEKHILQASAMYVKLLSEAEEPVSIIATGPLTNLAHLILNHPEFKAKIRVISFMGGSLKEGNVTPYAEFNAHVDPEALDIVLSSQIPLIMAGLDLTTNVRIKPEEVLKAIKQPNSTQQVFIDFIDYYAQAAAKRGELRGGALHDSLAVIAITHADLFKSELKSIVGDHSKTELRGQTREEGELNNVLVLTEVDPKRIIKLTIESIKQLGS